MGVESSLAFTIMESDAKRKGLGRVGGYYEGA